jgi:phenylpropionate dioxygenase-like ring-hydroxylating dioxygenase large terminal subunit
VLTHKQNETLARIRPETPLGDLFRLYWIPFYPADGLPPDGQPKRIKLSDEGLVAFGDSEERPGLIADACPHHGAPLMFGRNEECGLRCVYHGWKFDVDGNCLEQANVPPHQDFKQKVKAKAYKAEERNGVVWVYMGTQENVPGLPEIEATLCPEDDVEILFIVRECNWLQGAEGELDTSHLGVLHMGKVGADVYAKESINQYVLSNRAPEYKFAETDYGTSYAAYRPADEGNTYWRFGPYLWPFWTMPPICPLDNNILARAYVPIDDENTMMVYWMHNKAELPGKTDGRKEVVGGGDWNFLPNTTDWNGRWRLADNKVNDYNIDREVQRTKSYSGITGINLQDQAMSESMGDIVDRTMERLSPSDIMITQTRRHNLRDVQDYLKDGTLPKSATDPTVYRDVRGGQFVAPDGEEWLDAYDARLDGAALKPPMPEAAE